MDANTLKAASVLTGKLRAALTTESTGWVRRKDRGRVDPRAMAQLASGTTANVFQRRVRAEGIDTAILVAIDCSSSMSGELMGIAKAMTRMVNKTCDDLSIPLSIIGWGGSERHVRVQVAKKWDTPMALADEKIRNIVVNGGTPMAGGLGWSVGYMSQRDEGRRIILFLTDGAPDQEDGALGYMQRQLDKAAAAGIEVIPVAFGELAPGIIKAHGIFDNQAVVNVPEAKTLNKEVGAVLARRLHANKRGGALRSVRGNGEEEGLTSSELRTRTYKAVQDHWQKQHDARARAAAAAAAAANAGGGA